MQTRDVTVGRRPRMAAAAASRLGRTLLVAAILSAPLHRLHAAEPAVTSTSPGGITLNFRDADIDVVIAAFGHLLKQGAANSLGFQKGLAANGAGGNMRGGHHREGLVQRSGRIGHQRAVIEMMGRFQSPVSNMRRRCP